MRYTDEEIGVFKGERREIEKENGNFFLNYFYSYIIIYLKYQTATSQADD